AGGGGRTAASAALASARGGFLPAVANTAAGCVEVAEDAAFQLGGPGGGEVYAGRAVWHTVSGDDGQLGTGPALGGFPVGLGDALDLLGGDVHALHLAQVNDLVAQTGVGAVGALGLADERFAREHTLGDEDESFLFPFESAFHGLLPF